MAATHLTLIGGFSIDLSPLLLVNDQEEFYQSGVLFSVCSLSTYEMKDANVSVSVAFNDNRTRRLFEDNTMDTERRIEALRQLKKAGVRTGALLCQVVPYITDAIQLVDMLQPYADVIWIYGLSIDDRSGQNWLNFQSILNDQFPESIEQIEQAIFSKDHRYWAQLRYDLVTLKNDRQLNLNIRL